jgi:hypothetical protein
MNVKMKRIREGVVTFDGEGSAVWVVPVDGGEPRLWAWQERRGESDDDYLRRQCEAMEAQGLRIQRTYLEPAWMSPREAEVWAKTRLGLEVPADTIRKAYQRGTVSSARQDERGYWVAPIEEVVDYLEDKMVHSPAGDVTLREALEQFLAGYAPNTVKVYRAAIRRFHRVCDLAPSARVESVSAEDFLAYVREAHGLSTNAITALVGWAKYLGMEEEVLEALRAHY